jgi:hypothetical protein
MAIFPTHLNLPKMVISFKYFSIIIIVNSTEKLQILSRTEVKGNKCYGLLNRPLKVDIIQFAMQID